MSVKTLVAKTPGPEILGSRRCERRCRRERRTPDPLEGHLRLSGYFLCRTAFHWANLHHDKGPHTNEDPTATDKIMLQLKKTRLDWGRAWVRLGIMQPQESLVTTCPWRDQAPRDQAPCLSRTVGTDERPISLNARDATRQMVAALSRQERLRQSEGAGQTWTVPGDCTEVGWAKGIGCSPF